MNCNILFALNGSWIHTIVNKLSDVEKKYNFTILLYFYFFSGFLFYLSIFWEILFSLSVGENMCFLTSKIKIGINGILGFIKI